MAGDLAIAVAQVNPTVGDIGGVPLPAQAVQQVGLLEKKIVDRARNLPATAEVAYLQKQTGAMQVFRQRIPIRNVDNVIYQ